MLEINCAIAINSNLSLVLLILEYKMLPSFKFKQASSFSLCLNYVSYSTYHAELSLSNRKCITVQPHIGLQYNIIFKGLFEQCKNKL